MRAMTVLIQLHNKLSRFKEASDIQLKLVEILKAKHGLQHLETQINLKGLAEAYENQGRLLEANSLAAGDLLQGLLGPTDYMTLQTKRALIQNFRKRELFEKAVEVSQEKVSAYKDTLGDDDPKTLSAETELAVLINKTNKIEESIELQEKALQSFEAVNGKVNGDVARTLVNLGGMYLRDGRTEDGVVTVKRALAIYEELHGAESLEVGRCLQFLATAARNAGSRQDSSVYHERALEIERKVRGSDKNFTLHLMRCQAYDYTAMEKFEKAMVLQKEVLEGYRNLYDEGNKDVLGALFDIASLRHSLGNPQEAAILYEQAL
ncbi:hypothetical protein VE02_09328 [Pseudogymnoascus sp. 03VT05]|nr:hypothetical protein VE02_09328 [Pseudogymnoascus sp. 03VT05]